MYSETLRAVVDCLIPPDDYDAGVCDYLERIFQTDLAAQSEFFLAGIDGIDAEALDRFNKPFTNLTPDQKLSTLAAIESDQVTTRWPIPPSLFFEMLVNTTAEGY